MITTNVPCAKCKRTNYAICVKFTNNETLCYPCVSEEMPTDKEPATPVAKGATYRSTKKGKKK